MELLDLVNRALEAVKSGECAEVEIEHEFQNEKDEVSAVMRVSFRKETSTAATATILSPKQVSFGGEVARRPEEDAN